MRRSDAIFRRVGLYIILGISFFILCGGRLDPTKFENLLSIVVRGTGLLLFACITGAVLHLVGFIVFRIVQSLLAGITGHNENKIKGRSDAIFRRVGLYIILGISFFILCGGRLDPTKFENLLSIVVRGTGLLLFACITGAVLHLVGFIVFRIVQSLLAGITGHNENKIKGGGQ